MSMSGYTKLFNSILASTIWREPNHVRIVWITLLAMADRHGIAEGSVPGLADFARVSIDEARDALQRLQDPDRDSRSQVSEGRRIEPVDGGWRLLNHGKYREKLSADERREYLRQKQAERRRRRQQPVNNSQQMSTGVAPCRAASTLSTHTEADPEADPDTKAKEKSTSADALVPRARPLVKAPLTWVHGEHEHGYCDWMCFPTELFDQFVGRIVAAQSLTPDQAKTYVRDWAQRVRASGIHPTGKWFEFWNGQWDSTHASNKAEAQRAEVRRKFLEANRGQ